MCLRLTSIAEQVDATDSTWRYTCIRATPCIVVACVVCNCVVCTFIVVAIVAEAQRRREAISTPSAAPVGVWIAVALSTDKKPSYEDHDVFQ